MGLLRKIKSVTAITVIFAALLALSLITGFVNKRSSTQKEVTTSVVEEIKISLPNDNKTTKKQLHHIELNVSNTLLLFGVVDVANSNMLAQDITALDDGSSDPLYLLIDSPGGSVFSGAKVISAIEGSVRPVHTVCVGLCASMGAMIHSYGHKRLATDRSILMFHPYSGGYSGPGPNMMSLMYTINRYVHKMEVNVYKRAKMSKEAYESRILRDFWIDTEDAKNQGFVDELVVVQTPGFKLPVPNGYLSRPNRPNRSDTDRPDFWMWGNE